MFGRLKNRICSFLNRVLNNKKLSTYILFLFISFSFWFLSMISRNHETSLKIPIEYINFPADKILLSNPTHFLEVRVKAPGFSILFHNLFKYSRLQLDVQLANERFSKSGSEVFFLLNSKRKVISKILPSSMELVAVNPEKISLPFSYKEKKKVFIKLNQNISLMPEMWLSKDILIDPDSIIIYGDRRKLNEIDFINTEELVLSNLSESTINHLSLIIPDEVETKIEEVRVDIEIEEFVEQFLEHSVEIINIQKGYDMKLFPESVQLTVRLPKDKYSILKTDFLDVIVDASLISNKKRKLEVQVINLPEFIHLERIYPSNVEFMLIKE